MTPRAVSFIEIKNLNEEQRTVEGWASRPEVDRQGDIVVSEGLQPLRGKINLLLDHNHVQAVGTVEKVAATNAGVRFTARIAKIAQPGALQDLCNDAWEMVKFGLRAAVSIGFRPLDMEPMVSGGLRYSKWELLEISLVSVPACAGATIDQVKAFDRHLLRKASGGRVVRLNAPTRPVRVVKLHDGASISSPTGKAANPVGSAYLSASEQFAKALEVAVQSKAHGVAGAMLIQSTTAAAKATDAELAKLCNRLDQLEARRGR